MRQSHQGCQPNLTISGTNLARLVIWRVSAIYAKKYNDVGNHVELEVDVFFV